ncbi:MAG: thioredoxin fold domain-containing protein [Rhodobacteraceae bacterium]|nr:thioredoxin fold domain-containing protein [Paracoccaceae bacterium]
MDRRVFLTTLAVGPFAGSAFAESIVADDGLHKQDWFLDSFLEMPDDLQEAADQGKHLLVLVEQKGCPYCRELHNVNFEREEITSYIKENFLVVQLNMWGSRGTVDFDGEELEERDLVAKWGVQFTPTTLIFDSAEIGAADARRAEAFRLPGYLKPFHYISSLEYVVDGAYKTQGFQRYIQEKFKALEAQGIHPDIW